MSRILTLQKMLDESPDDSFLRFAIAKEFEKEKDWDKAMEYYKWIVQNDPEYVGVYYHLGAVFVEIEQYAEALKIYSAGIKVAQKLADFHSLSELANAKQNLEIEYNL